VLEFLLDSDDEDVAAATAWTCERRCEGDSHTNMSLMTVVSASQRGTPFGSTCFPTEGGPTGGRCCGGVCRGRFCVSEMRGGRLVGEVLQA
jgi:hypothetical protein